MGDTVTTYWLSCTRFTVLVETDDGGIIVRTAPIVRKFIGQPFSNLTRWAERFGGLRVERLA